MLSNGRAAWLAALLGATTASAACSSDLLVDDFSSFSSAINNLNSPVGDDETMTSVTPGADGTITVVPSTLDSYWYETFDCMAAASEGYNAVVFTIQGPANGSVALELQTKNDCADEARMSDYASITGLSRDSEEIVVPLSSFGEGPNLDSIVGLVWSRFSSAEITEWSLGNVRLACDPDRPTGVSTTTETPTLTLAPTSNPTSEPTSEPTSSDCPNLLIDDWASQSRLTFLGYNGMQQASSDDGTMESIVVDSNRVMLSPQDTDSYFYSQFGCLDTEDDYGGVSFTIRASAGTSFTVTLTSVSECGGETTGQTTRTTAQLDWVFDGTEQLYSFPFSAFPGIDTTKLQMIYFSTLNSPVVFGPMSFYCGDTASEYVLSAGPPTNTAVATVMAPSTTSAQFIVDSFGKVDTNDLGRWHGADDGLLATFGGRNSMTISTNDSDLAWYTQLGDTCVDFRGWQDAYLHVAYTGSNKFSIALQQHNEECNEDKAPFPETWDSLEAARYTTGNDIYLPISHFNVNLTRVVGFAFKGFYTTDPTTFHTVEIVDSVPDNVKMPSKLPSGSLVFACKRPNSFAFAIDDGQPELAQQVMDIVKSENINVTFFTVGLPLLDPTTNLSNVYRDMQKRGHQIAMHSYTHPKMEGLPDIASIDWEYDNDIGAVKQVFGGMHTPYFRPPFGTEGARMRQRLAATLGIDNPYIVQWNIDVEDWLWAESKTPEKQLEAFKRDLDKGGNLVVMHYLYQSTVDYLREFIQLAKATGKDLMRVDQCMMDPDAPPL